MTDSIPMTKYLSYKINVRTSITPLCVHIYVCTCIYVIYTVCEMGVFCSSDLTDGSGLRKWNVTESAHVL